MSAATASRSAMQAVSKSTVRKMHIAWASVDPERVAASWTAQLPAARAVLTTAQYASAALAEPLADTLGGRTAERVNSAAFAGLASDGRPLLGLLFQPALTVLHLLSTGWSKPRALASGRATLDMLTSTQVADAYRLATGVAVVAHPELAGYERIVHLPACDRCIVLAGKIYRWSQGFQRHPSCDCTMEPVTREQYRERNLDNHPRALFEQMSTLDQDRRFGKANADAIRDGADITQVVNARHGMQSSVDGFGHRTKTTTVGAHGQAARLTPESIYQEAASREDALAMLKRYGYIF